MSKTLRQQEPRSEIKADAQHLVYQGARRVTEQVIVSDSSDLNQSLFSIFPPSNDTIVDRKFKVRHYIQVTSTGGDFQLGTNDALRQFPMSSVIDTTQVSINGESLSDNTEQKLHAMLCYGNDARDRGRDWSATAAQPDAYQKYSDWQTYGSSRNPMADYGENSAETTRGGFPVVDVSGSVKRFVVTEPLLLSPFLAQEQDEGMVNVSQLNVALRYKSSLSRVMSHAASGNAITSIAVSFYQAPEILCSFLSPQEGQMIPATQAMVYHKPLDYIRSVPSLAAAEQTTVHSDTIRLNQIPERMFVFCRRKQNSSTFHTSDSFLRIDRCNINWNNETSLLGNATEQQLYEMSKDNGLNLSFSDWHKYRGSVLCVRPGKDIGLPSHHAAGVKGQYTIQVSLTVTNVSDAAYDSDMYLVAQMGGVLYLSENAAVASLGSLNEQDVMASKNGEHLSSSDAGATGSGFWSSIKHLIKRIPRALVSIEKYGAPIATALGRPDVAAGLSTAGRVGKALGGRAQVGGSRSGNLRGRRVM